MRSIARRYAEFLRQPHVARLLGVALRSTQALAHAVGMGDLHRFLRLGYQAIQPVRDITRFLTTIETRERARLDRIYAI